MPQLGTLNIQTEMGWLSVAPNEIAVVPRGIRFSVQLAEGSTQSRGYVMEVYNSRFELPDLGPIGKNMKRNEY